MRSTPTSRAAPTVPSRRLTCSPWPRRRAPRARSSLGERPAAPKGARTAVRQDGGSVRADWRSRAQEPARSAFGGRTAPAGPLPMAAALAPALDAARAQAQAPQAQAEEDALAAQRHSRCAPTRTAPPFSSEVRATASGRTASPDLFARRPGPAGQRRLVFLQPSEFHPAIRLRLQAASTEDSSVRHRDAACAGVRPGVHHASLLPSSTWRLVWPKRKALEIVRLGRSAGDAAGQARRRCTSACQATVAAGPRCGWRCHRLVDIGVPYQIMNADPPTRAPARTWRARPGRRARSMRPSLWGPIGGYIAVRQRSAERRSASCR